MTIISTTADPRRNLIIFVSAMLAGGGAAWLGLLLNGMHPFRIADWARAWRLLCLDPTSVGVGLALVGLGVAGAVASASNLAESSADHRDPRA